MSLDVTCVDTGVIYEVILRFVVRENIVKTAVFAILCAFYIKLEKQAASYDNNIPPPFGCKITTLVASSSSIMQLINALLTYNTREKSIPN